MQFRSPPPLRNQICFVRLSWFWPPACQTILFAYAYDSCSRAMTRADSLANLTEPESWRPRTDTWHRPARGRQVRPALGRLRRKVGHDPAASGDTRPPSIPPLTDSSSSQSRVERLESALPTQCIVRFRPIPCMRLLAPEWCRRAVRARAALLNYRP